MAVQTTRTLPAQFVEDLGKDLANTGSSTIRCTCSINRYSWYYHNNLVKQLQILKQDNRQQENLQQDNKV